MSRRLPLGASPRNSLFRPAGRAERSLQADAFGRRELAAAAGLALLALHLLFGQLTLVLAVVFIGIGRVSRWRADWLAVPAVSGLVWALATGLPAAAAGLIGGPRQIVRALAATVSGAQGGLAHLTAAYASAGNWLPRQLPLALIAAAAEAVFASVAWQRRQRLRQPAGGRVMRPGIIRLARRWTATRALAAGAVVTRAGCGLGIDSADDRLAELSWREASGGVLLAGQQMAQLRRAGCAIATAAILRRKTVLLVDATGDRELAAVIARACAAEGVDLERPTAGLGCQAIGDAIAARSVVLYRPAGATPDRQASGGAATPALSPSEAAVPLSPARPATRAGVRVSPGQAAAADLVAVLSELADDQLRADCLIWLHGCDRAQADTLRSLVEFGRRTGTAVLLSTADAAAAATLAGTAEVLLLAGPADLTLATDVLELAGWQQLRRGGRRPAASMPGGASGDVWPSFPGQMRQGALVDSLMQQDQRDFTLVARGSRARVQAGWLPDPSSAGAAW